jgi:hypothetical protein
LPRILLDQNLARALRDLIPGHDVTHASERGWATLENGALLSAADAAGFEVMITADQNIRYQQNLSGRNLALVVLSTNHWPTIRGSASLIVNALSGVAVGSYQEVAFELPPLRRRPPPDRSGPGSS